MRWNELCDDPCPVARSLAVIGDRWTLLVLRECFFGVRRFEQFQERLGITRHVLAERLRKLEGEGVLTRVPYQQRPLRCEYRLTDKGKDLHDVLMTLVAWAERHAPPDEERGEPFTLIMRDTGKPAEPVVTDATSGQRITCKTVYAERSGDESARSGRSSAVRDG